jgi:hypothetical protein
MLQRSQLFFRLVEANAPVVHYEEFQAYCKGKDASSYYAKKLISKLGVKRDGQSLEMKTLSTFTLWQQLHIEKYYFLFGSV